MYSTQTWMTFNGLDFDEFFVVESVTRSLMPGISNSYVKSNHIRTEIAPTVITVRIRLIEDTPLDLTEIKRQIAGKLFTDKPAKLLLYDDPTRYDMAKLDGATDFNKLWTSGSAELNFLNASGISYDETPISTSFTTSNSLAVGGTWKTKPKFTIVFGTTAPSYKITNSTTGKYVEVTTPFAIGNTLIIDCEKELVTLNGNPIMPKVSMLSDFFDLIPGVNVLTSPRSVTVSYRSAWL